MLEGWRRSGRRGMDAPQWEIEAEVSYIPHTESGLQKILVEAALSPKVLYGDFSRSDLILANMG